MASKFNNLRINNLDAGAEFEKKIVFFLENWFSDSEKVEVQTSGSTGIPKVFEIEKKRMVNSAKMTCDFLGLKEGDTALLCLPVEYISGKMMLVRSAIRHLELFISEPSVKPLKNLDREIDFCALTPLQVEHSLDRLPLVKNLIIGGAAVSESLKQKISGSENHIYETYGMSETLSHIALKQLAPVSEDYFTAFDQVSIATDDRGCLKIYAPELNEEVLQTNDLVEIINEKQFRFLGRADNVINSGGAKIFPEQLETVVKREIPNEAVFLGLEDEILGQKLILVIEGEDSDKIREVIQNIPFEKSFHHPKDIIFISEIPRTPNGKVSRIGLKEKVSQ
ncbi:MULTISPECIES: AMP-binding protein [Chryseobacterium]|uniref:O-succinylbenzoic acid--CoA ligase n=1 Tax=Chryseobacterium camelliae TaxID=1265445 RepID=A0ABU0TKF6_9FLAO|nr:MULTISPECIES: AMP-binding protein [Chryseobacterium]MDT3408615.1 O-succinylbenzoic acid--CoA ligase [Pseudacidovorax intermedius]MDQ1097530.1 O-succinylbenzoic acid--CoA ligase [Chryseobacterium camelliae]MDQ1101459.1 O-succinylbenzoic acid--CoA ligase [Chryseobacterium sp. SORGH_AS_1048]MDR6084903.1 O-succinylbenzoic acid--CoA ligase [Chryseobacterium sp. SORGH_AS_0909]MDR6129255.1 O-succinylbenzoic acid--CoA ligase [Chryseobacterium sp. SORGH_AS_1175]